MQKYSAPALTKGLKILEFMATQKFPVTLQNLATELQMSISQIYRIVQVLQSSGYITKDIHSETFVLTHKIFLLGMHFRDNSTLLECVSPILDKISQYTHQSCHFVIQTDSNISVIARAYPDTKIGFSVKIGYTKPMCHTNSGMLLLAYLPENEQTRILGIHTYHDVFKKIRDKSFYISRSFYTRGIIDISIPLFSAFNHKLLGAITLSYIHILDNPLSLKDTLTYIKTYNPCLIPY